MKRLGLLLACLPCALLVLPGTAPAATDAEWLTLGYGRGSPAGDTSNELLDDAAMIVGGGVQSGPHLATLRYARVGWDAATGDLALLYGRVLADGGARVTWGLGPGLLFRHGPSSDPQPDCCAWLGFDAADAWFDRVGLAWSAQVAWPLGSDFNAGLQAFGSLAGNRGFAGLAAVVNIGPQVRKP